MGMPTFYDLRAEALKDLEYAQGGGLENQINEMREEEEAHDDE